MTLIDDVLEGLRLRSAVFSRMTLRGEWGFAKDALQGAPFHLLLSGEAWLQVKGESEGVALQAGDIVILPRGDPHLFLARPGAPAVPWRAVAESRGWAPWRPGSRFKAVDLEFGTGDPHTRLVSGVYAFEDPRRNPLLDALPSLLLMRASADSVPARAASAMPPLMEAEILSGSPGAESVCTRLADIVFIQTVRHYLGEAEALPQGWLRGMTSSELAPVLSAIHRSPERPWTVETLAREGGMSRSRFAARFSEAVGQAPLDYLTRWRMYRAAGRLAHERASLTEIAASVGYGSQVSFGKAFRRWSGRSPAAYRRWLRERDGSVLAREDE